METIEHGNTWITGTGDNMHWQLLSVTAGAASEHWIFIKLYKQNDFNIFDAKIRSLGDTFHGCFQALFNQDKVFVTPTVEGDGSLCHVI